MVVVCVAIARLTFTCRLFRRRLWGDAYCVCSVCNQQPGMNEHWPRTWSCNPDVRLHAGTTKANVAQRGLHSPVVQHKRNPTAQKHSQAKSMPILIHTSTNHPDATSAQLERNRNTTESHLTQHRCPAHPALRPPMLLPPTQRAAQLAPTLSTTPMPLVRPSRNTKRVPGVMYSGRCRNLKRTQALQVHTQQATRMAVCQSLRHGQCNACPR